MQENSQLRRQIIHRTEEFSSYKAAIEQSQSQVLRDFGARARVVIQARKAANLSLAVGLREEERAPDGGLGLRKGRPGSAPTTAAELNLAKRQADVRNHKAVHAQTTLLSARPHTRL